MKFWKLPLNLKGHLWSATFEAFDFSTKVLRGLAGRHMKTKYLKLMPSKKALKTITYFSSERSNFLIPNDSKDDITFRSINLILISKIFHFGFKIKFSIFLKARISEIVRWKTFLSYNLLNLLKKKFICILHIDTRKQSKKLQIDIM